MLLSSFSVRCILMLFEDGFLLWYSSTLVVAVLSPLLLRVT